MYLAKYTCLEDMVLRTSLHVLEQIRIAPLNRTRCELFRLLPGTVVSSITGGLSSNFTNGCLKEGYPLSDERSENLFMFFVLNKFYF